MTRKGISEMKSAQEVFAEYGADYSTTMKRVMNNEAMYVRLLGMLAEDDSIAKLDDALQAGNLQSAFLAAHTLKGVAGNLGLTPLYQALEKLVEPLRAEAARDDYPALYKEVQLAFMRTDAFREALKGATQTC